MYIRSAFISFGSCIVKLLLSMRMRSTGYQRSRPNPEREILDGQGAVKNIGAGLDKCMDDGHGPAARHYISTGYHDTRVPGCGLEFGGVYGNLWPQLWQY